MPIDHAPSFGFYPGRWLALPIESGSRTVLVGAGEGLSEPAQLLWLGAGLGDRLPPGDYALENEFADARDEIIATGWTLGSYRFNRYRKSAGNALPRLRRSVRLFIGRSEDQSKVRSRRVVQQLKLGFVGRSQLTRNIQPQACPVAMRRHKWLEDLSAKPIRHSAAVIDDVQFDSPCRL